MFQVSIETTNAAFEDQEHIEVARILRDIAKAVEGGAMNGTARDLNGNRVAFFSYTPAA